MTSPPSSAGGRQCVIVSDRPWHSELATRLTRRTGRTFVHISDPVDLTIEHLGAISPEFVFFPHWSHRIDRRIHETFACVIFHMTDLPFGRGGSPLQNLIVRGFSETKISALRCVSELDAGPIYLKRSLSLLGTAEEIFLRASDVIEGMIVEMLDKTPEAVAQTGVPTLFKRRKADEGDLALAESLEQAFDLIRMLDADGYPPAFVHIGPFKLEFTRASMRSGHLLANVRIRLSSSAPTEPSQP